MPYSVIKCLISGDRTPTNPRLFLAFSCASTDENESVVPGACARRFTFSRLSAANIQARLDERFHPNAFPADLADALRRYSQGAPAYVARKVLDLVEEDGFIRETTGCGVSRKEDSPHQF